MHLGSLCDLFQTEQPTALERDEEFAVGDGHAVKHRTGVQFDFPGLHSIHGIHKSDELGVVAAELS